MTFEAQPQTLVAKLMGFIMKPMINSCKKETQKALDDLKTAVETSASSAAGR